MARKKAGGHGGHGWFVTFADLMGLLMSFFVMLTAFSTQDQKKLQMVAGSMRDAFGIQKLSRYAGIVELDGIPVRPNLKHAEVVSSEQASDHTAPKRDKIRRDGIIDTGYPRQFTTAAASLRQALQELPEIAEVSKNVMMEESPLGLNLQLIDQDARAMFVEGSAVPNDRLRQILSKVAPVVARMPNRISITGHTAATRGGQRSTSWTVSTARAEAVRDLLSRSGLPDTRIHSVVGRADTDPLFPEDPYQAANRRVSILLLKEAAPLPDSFKP